MKYHASLHGHSRHSDGHNSVTQIVNAAHKYDITYLALTDHNSVRGISELYDAAEKINTISQQKILPIAGMEMLTQQGEILILKPSPYKAAQKFLHWCQTHIDSKNQLPLDEAIQTAIHEYDALVVIPHPGLFSGGTLSISLPDIRHTIQQLDLKTKKNIALEVHNWSSKIFGQPNKLRELEVIELAENLKLTQIGGTDYHATWQLPLQTTIIETENPSYENFINAFQNQLLHPSHSIPTTFANKISLIATLGLSYIRTFFNYPYPSKTLTRKTTSFDKKINNMSS